MEGKRVDTSQIRKGPRKAEGDEVLINHVKIYALETGAPFDSKAFCKELVILLLNLRSGCKFTTEEERVVVELQAQFGKKWAKIAKHLSGRTDNDVKNFWSSRRQTLARILQNSRASSHSKSLKIKKEVPGFHNIPTSEFSSSMEEVSYSRDQLCTSYYLENSQTNNMEQFPDLVNPNLCNLMQKPCSLRLSKPYAEAQSQIFFPQIPQAQPYLTISLENRDLLTKLEDPYFLQVFAPMDVPELGSGPLGQLFLDPVRSSGFGTREDTEIPVTLDAFFDDFPADMF